MTSGEGGDEIEVRKIQTRFPVFRDLNHLSSNPQISGTRANIRRKGWLLSSEMAWSARFDFLRLVRRLNIFKFNLNPVMVLKTESPSSNHNIYYLII